MYNHAGMNSAGKEEETGIKKAAIVWSSPNTDGLTASAKNQFMKGLTDAGGQVEEIHLNRRQIEHCRAF